ncbi:MAG TPA: efflux RND transporter periplasmic adaptor subunit [Xanthobacteraceae bacterium]|nr:efflux RND transporter periplasmic adaptor subunit [Xanthobacteraceae bacterium]
MLAGCDEPVAASAAPAPAPNVSVITVKEEPRTLVRELPGRIAPTRIADVRSRVSGIVVERLFHQGSQVKAGDPLYRIDPKPFEVELQAAQAALAKAEALRDQTVSRAKRFETLAGHAAVSQAENENAIAAMRQAVADVAAREADVARAKLNLDYATIRAPIDGVIGAALVSEGALVVQNDATSLATIQQIETIYVDFTQSASELSKLRRAFETGELERVDRGVAKVRLVLDDGAAYPIDGRLLFSEAKVDANTGQVTLRGEFQNPKHDLLPGMYARVRIEQGVDSDAITVPQQAVQFSTSGETQVFVVKPDNRVAIQAIRTGEMVEDQWMVLDGLKPGERVVVEGFQKFAAGDAVTPNAWAESEVAVGNRPATETKLR